MPTPWEQLQPSFLRVIAPTPVGHLTGSRSELDRATLSVEPTPRSTQRPGGALCRALRQEKACEGQGWRPRDAGWVLLHNRGPGAEQGKEDASGGEELSRHRQAAGLSRGWKRRAWRGSAPRRQAAVTHRVPLCPPPGFVFTPPHTPTWAMPPAPCVSGENQGDQAKLKGSELKPGP